MEEGRDAEGEEVLRAGGEARDEAGGWVGLVPARTRGERRVEGEGTWGAHCS